MKRLKCRLFGHSWRIWMAQKSVFVWLVGHKYDAHDFVADECTRCGVFREAFYFHVEHPAGVVCRRGVQVMDSLLDTRLWFEPEEPEDSEVCHE